jgi:undecaprenyl-diphosphatase
VLADMKETIQILNKLDVQWTGRIQLRSMDGATWKLAAILSHSGDSWLWATAVGLIWLLSFSYPDLHRLSAILEVSIVIQALSIFVLKRLIHRQRPDGEWGGIYRQIDPHSFPSGHATRAAMLSVLGLAFGPSWLGWLLVIWTPLVCTARVMTGVHYVSDISGGIILGLLLGAAFVAITPLWMQAFPFLF